MSKRASSQNDQRLTAVEVAGFKSAMAPVRVNLRDITVLAGANSAGKSTIMQPLLMIKQTIEKPFDPGAIAIDGPLARFTNADQFLSYNTPEHRMHKFNIIFEYNKNKMSFTYSRSAIFGISLIEISFSRGKKNYSWQDGQILSKDHESIADALAVAGLPAGFKKNLTWKLRIGRDHAVLAIGDDYYAGGASTGIGYFYFSPCTVVVNDVQNMIYVPGLRGNPERHYAISASGPKYPGSFNDYVASVIHRWTATEDDNLKILEANLRQLGLTWRVTTRAVDDTRVEVRVGRLPVAARGGARDTVNIADVGFGVSQTLPVLVAFLAAAPGQMVYVEQPELHLHPRAQVALADIIVQAADRGARVIIETHSSLLILALQTAIAEGRVTPDRVSMNWFTRDNKGQTHVAEAEFAKDGSYGDWPVDFDDVESDLQNRYLNLVDRLRAEG
jgi:predicted ATPase